MVVVEEKTCAKSYRLTGNLRSCHGRSQLESDGSLELRSALPRSIDYIAMMVPWWNRKSHLSPSDRIQTELRRQVRPVFSALKVSKMTSTCKGTAIKSVAVISSGVCSEVRASVIDSAFQMRPDAPNSTKSGWSSARTRSGWRRTSGSRSWRSRRMTSLHASSVLMESA